MYSFKVILLAVALTVGVSDAFVVPQAGYCSLSVTSLSPEPVVVSSTTLEFLYPEPSESSIRVASDETFLISCPGGTLRAGSLSIKSNTVLAKCVSGSELTILDQSVSFNSISCSRNAFHTARYSGKSCESKGKEVEVGYVIDNDKSDFVRQITICFDDVNLNTLYSMYALTKSIGSHESGINRPSFIEDDFYTDLSPTHLDDLYSRSGQRATINSLLGLDYNSQKYVKDSGDFFFSRGHLTAKADFVYGHQQTATFHYINTAPQWQIFNGRNWNTAEMDVRDYAESRGLDLIVYTGTYGISTLPHEQTGKETPLYFYAKGSVKKIPIPEVYWKVVYDPATKKGVALLGINNPYIKNIEKSIICEDISSKINWLNWNAGDVYSGISYVCDVNELKKIVPHLPNLQVTGLLL